MSTANISNLYSEDQDSVYGYAVGKFPTNLSVGDNSAVNSVSDSDAYTGMRGLTNSRAPLPSYPMYDNGKVNTVLADNFNMSDIAASGSLNPNNNQLPSADNQSFQMSEAILREYNAGSSTYNVLDTAAGPYTSGDYTNNSSQRGGRSDFSAFNDMNSTSIVQQHQQSMTRPEQNDLPIMPYHRQYYNFGNGNVDYGYDNPDLKTQEAMILQQMHNTLPQSELAGAKADLMPVFSTTNQIAVEQRPILQSLGKMKTYNYFGMTVPSDDVAIDPTYVVKAESNIPGNLVQTGSELASYLRLQGENNKNNNGFAKSAYGYGLQSVKTVAGGEMPMNSSEYSYISSKSNEPLSFSDDNVMSYIFNKNVM